MIECSKAIKCPSVGVFLAGMKILQEYMSNDNNLNRITDNNYELNERLKCVFGKYYRLDSKVEFFFYLFFISNPM